MVQTGTTGLFEFVGCRNPAVEKDGATGLDIAFELTSSVCCWMDRNYIL